MTNASLTKDVLSSPAQHQRAPPAPGWRHNHKGGAWREGLSPETSSTSSSSIWTPGSPGLGTRPPLEFLLPVTPASSVTSTSQGWSPLAVLCARRCVSGLLPADEPSPHQAQRGDSGKASQSGAAPGFGGVCGVAEHPRESGAAPGFRGVRGVAEHPRGSHVGGSACPAGEAALEVGCSGRGSARHPLDQARLLSGHTGSHTPPDVQSATAELISQSPMQCSIDRTTCRGSDPQIGFSRIPRAPIRPSGPNVSNSGHLGSSNDMKLCRARVSQAHPSPPFQNLQQAAASCAEARPGAAEHRTVRGKAGPAPPDTGPQDAYDAQAASADFPGTTPNRSAQNLPFPTVGTPLMKGAPLLPVQQGSLLPEGDRSGETETPPPAAVALAPSAANPRPPLQICGGILPLAKRARRYPSQNRPPRPNAPRQGQNLCPPAEPPSGPQGLPIPPVAAPACPAVHSNAQASGSIPTPHGSPAPAPVKKESPSMLMERGQMDMMAERTHVREVLSNLTTPVGTRPAPKDAAGGRTDATPLPVILAAPRPPTSVHACPPSGASVKYASNSSSFPRSDTMGGKASEKAGGWGSEFHLNAPDVGTLHPRPRAFVARPWEGVPPAGTLQHVPKAFCVVKSPAEVADAVFAEAERRAALARRRKRRVEQIVALQWRTFAAARKAEQRERQQGGEACRHRIRALLAAGWTAFHRNAFEVRALC
jgi:hypothetical protein